MIGLKATDCVPFVLRFVARTAAERACAMNAATIRTASKVVLSAGALCRTNFVLCVQFQVRDEPHFQLLLLKGLRAEQGGVW